MPNSARRRRTIRSAAVALPAAGTLVAGLLATMPAQASTASGHSQLAGTHPSWATATADKGALAGSTRLTATVYLASQNPSGLAAYAQAVSTPGGASYGKFLTAGQALAEYGPSAAAVSSVRSWLASDGITVTNATPQALTISGTASQLDAAFSTRLDVYQTSNGTHRAPATTAEIPASLSGAVLGVVGLSDTQPLARVDSVKVGNSTPSPTNACSTYWDQYTATGVPAGYVKTTPTDPCSYYPAQERKAYGITASGLTGKGATIAIVDAYASSTMLSDANQYATNHGDKAFRSGQYKEYVTPADWNSQAACGDWTPEEALDVEMSHGLAPDANVVYVGANSCQDSDLLAAEALIVDNHLADVVSNSWGEIMHSTVNGDIPQAEIDAYNQVFEQGTVEGIGFNFSAGDCGDDDPSIVTTGANCDPTSAEPQTEWPTSDQWVTSVGGSMLAISKPNGSYEFEGSMGTLRSSLVNGAWSPALPAPFFFGGGGGTSADFTQPWYQRFAVPFKTSHTLLTGQTTPTAMRTVPDVSMNGDLYTSVLVGLSDGSPYSEAGYGGTSVSSPSFAAVIADAIQAHGRAIGFADPALYLRQGLYNDVRDTGKTLSAVFESSPTRIRLIKFESDGVLKATPGYDTATGLGSPTSLFLESFGWFGARH